MRAAAVAPLSPELSMIFSCSHEGVDAGGGVGRLSFDAALRLSVAWAGTPGRGAATGTGMARAATMGMGPGRRRGRRRGATGASMGAATGAAGDRAEEKKQMKTDEICKCCLYRMGL